MEIKINFKYKVTVSLLEILNMPQFGYSIPDLFRSDWSYYEQGPAGEHIKYRHEKIEYKTSTGHFIIYNLNDHSVVVQAGQHAIAFGQVISNYLETMFMQKNAYDSDNLHHVEDVTVTTHFEDTDRVREFFLARFDIPDKYSDKFIVTNCIDEYHCDGYRTNKVPFSDWRIVKHSKIYNHNKRHMYPRWMEFHNNNTHRDKEPDIPIP